MAMMAKQALMQKPQKPIEYKRVVRVTPPKVDVRVDAPQVTVDSREFAAAINVLSRHVATLCDAQNTLLRAVADNAQKIADVAEALRGMGQKMAAPVKSGPARPRSFSVEFDKEDGETVGLRIVADGPH